MSDYKEFSNFELSGKFKVDTVPTLIPTLQRFLGCKVDFIDAPKRYLTERHRIDILENPSRGCYPINDNEVILLGRILPHGKLLSAMGFRLHKGAFRHYTKLLNILERSLTNEVTRGWEQHFRNAPFSFGQQFLERTLARYCAVSSPSQFRFIIHEFDKLSRTTLEGRPFTTGLLLTRSIHSFGTRNVDKKTRGGIVVELNSPKKISYVPKLEKRFWYLVDGKTSFYISDHLHRIKHILFPEASTGYYQDSANFLQRADALLRVTANNEFSVMSSNGIEFVFQENCWRARSFQLLKDLMSAAVAMEENILTVFIDIILEISRRRLSSLIVIPQCPSAISEILCNKNTLTTERLNICDRRQLDLILRLLTSDGASVIDCTGNLLHYGCILAPATLPSPTNNPILRGTGENAAEFLGKSGFAIKVSQDGAATLFAGESEPYLI